MVRLCVFDLDGTLVDSRRDLAEAANAVLAACGCAILSEEAIGRMVGDGAATLVRRAFEAAGCAQPPDALERFLSIYNGRLLQSTRPYPGMTDLLDTLQARVLLGVLTNKPLHATRVILDGLGLARYFPSAWVLGGDGPHPRKPDPAGLRQLVGDAQVDADQTLLVGDSIIDWETANRAGTRICLARYGFGFEGFPVGRLRASDLVVDAPEQLAAFL